MSRDRSSRENRLLAVKAIANYQRRLSANDLDSFRIYNYYKLEFPRN